jgi:hypothetical protein
MSTESTGLHKRRAELASGLPVTELATLFRTNRQNVRKKLAGVKPIGDRAGDPVYDIYDAAQVLVKPNVDLAEYIKTMRPNDVPPALQKQFWDGQLGRQKFEELAGNLWRTEKVQLAMADLLKIVRQQIQLMSDTVERETGLTEEQRKIIFGISDNVQDSLHKAVLNHFQNYTPVDERDPVFEHGPPAQNIDTGDDFASDADALDFGGL